MARPDFSGSAMIALYPRENEARDLALEDAQPADDLHVTLIYLGSARETLPMAEVITAVAGGVASATEPLEGAVGGVATFEEGPDGAPVVLLPDVPGLTELGTTVRDELARIGVESASEHGFNPHMTVAYGGDPAAAQDRIGAPLHFDTLSVVVGEDRFDYPLQSPPQALLSGADCPCAQLPSGGTMRDPIQELAVRALGPEREQRLSLLASLSAAGIEDAVEPVTTYDLARGSLGERKYYAEVIRAGYSETRHAAWPSEAELADHGEVLYRDEHEAVFRLPGDVLAHVGIRGGWLQARFAAATRSEGADAVTTFAHAYPPLYADPDAMAGTVPITFWTNSQYGPVSRLRRIEASYWDTITGNYAAAARGELERLVGDFEPGAEGQLLLWQGPPGTGKTWALRALAAEWAEWAEFHYITDPDAFFVSNPSYMIDVLLSDSYETLTAGPGEEVLTNVREDGKWKVLILEDTGKLLSESAEEAYGQGLSRLLNVVDGMVGQGLRVLAIVTTNEEIGDLHPAVVRPGRCASQIVFGPLSADEASAWLGTEVEDGGTLAELYERRGAGERAFEERTAEEEIAALRAAMDALGDRIGLEIRDASENFPGGEDVGGLIADAVNASQLQWEGVLMMEGKPTDDGRMIEVGAIDWRMLPLTLMAQLVTADGHNEAVVAGRIDEIWRDGNRIMGRGVFDAGENGAEVARLVEERMLRGVSVDLAIRSFEYRPLNEDGTVGTDLSEEQMLDAILSEAKMVYVVTDGSIGAATVCSFPAFADAEIALVASAPLRWRITTQTAMTITKAEAPASDSSSEGEVETVVTASAAGLAPLIPPAEWFEDPALTEPTPLQVTEDGRIFGHAAVWDACHMGFEDACVLAPRSRTDYAYFLLGQVMVETERDGENVLAQQIPCGTVTLGTGHAPLRLTRAAAVEHYDDTGTAAADVNVGEDEHGIWLAGAIRPDLSEERVRELRASKISGDWREYAGNLELIAMLAVNVPGFPIPRVRVATAGPEPLAAALVAAGVADPRVLDALRERQAAEPELAAEALEQGLEAAAEAPAGEPLRGTLAEAALLTLASAHSRTVEAVEKITSAPPGDEERGKRELALAQKSLEVIERFAVRDHAPVPDVHVHVPERAVTVEGPHVTVEATPAPTVEVQNEIHVPEQPTPHVTVAAAPPAPAPTVVVEAAKPRRVRVEEDPETGERLYVSE